MTSWKEYRREWVKRNACKFCGGNDLHTCLSYQCQEAVTTAGRYFDNVIKREEIKKRNEEGRNNTGIQELFQLHKKTEGG